MSASFLNARCNLREDAGLVSSVKQSRARWAEPLLIEDLEVCAYDKCRRLASVHLGMQCAVELNLSYCWQYHIGTRWKVDPAGKTSAFVDPTSIGEGGLT